MSTTHALKEELKGFLPWHQAWLDCLSHLQVQLALAFDVSVQSASVYQRVKRFSRHHVFETDHVFISPGVDQNTNLQMSINKAVVGEVGRTALQHVYGTFVWCPFKSSDV